MSEYIEYGGGRRILIIEDNPNNARIMRRVLERHAYRVEVAPDGESGLEMALSSPPDLILLDLGLPDVDGQTVAGMLKQRESGLPDTPLVVVTAWPADTARDMIRAYGCDGYIPKPINTRSFASEVTDYLDS